MALIPCPECGRQISDKAPTCPRCGCPANSFVPAKCAECGHQLKDAAETCPQCGCPGAVPASAPLQADAGPPPVSPATQQQRPLTSTAGIRAPRWFLYGGLLLGIGLTVTCIGAMIANDWLMAVGGLLSTPGLVMTCIGQVLHLKREVLCVIRENGFSWKRFWCNLIVLIILGSVLGMFSYHGCQEHDELQRLRFMEEHHLHWDFKPQHEPGQSH